MLAQVVVVLVVVQGWWLGVTQCQLGVPESAYGCPDASRITWERGRLSVGSPWNLTTWSDDVSVRGPLSRAGLTLSFCILADEEQDSFQWPVGRYCVFSFGDSCLAEFHAANIQTNLTASLVTALAGKIPVRMGEDDVTFNFCCRDDNSGIDLPSLLKSPFITLPYAGEQCQAFKNHSSTMQHIDFGDVKIIGDSASSAPWTGVTLSMKFCLHDPYDIWTEPCEDGWEAHENYCYEFHRDLRSWHDAQKSCSLAGANLYSIQSPSEMEYIINMTLYLSVVWPRPPHLQVDFENYWTGLHDMDQEMVWTYVDGTPYDETITNWNEFEPNDWLSGEDCQEWRVNTVGNNDNGCWKLRRSICKKPRLPHIDDVALEKPTRQSSTEADLAASLAVDTQQSVTCSQTRRGGRHWWQVDLHEVHLVYGLEIITGTNLPGSLSVTLGDLPNAFQRGSALFCTDFAVQQRVTLLPCVQPITGQYVTIEMTSDEEVGYLVPYLELCRVKVFGRATSCGIPLGLSTGEIGSMALSASSWARRDYPHKARLNGQDMWCADEGDTHMYIQIDLGTQRSIYGLVVGQGDDSSHVTKFTLTYQNEAGQEEIYQEFKDIDKVFPGPVSSSQVRHVLFKSISTDVFRLVIQEFMGQPCLKLELLECKGDSLGVRCSSNYGFSALNFTHNFPASSAILVGSPFTCRGIITSWEFFLTEADHHLSLTVWRYIDGETLKVVGFTQITELQRGRHSIRLNQPIVVDIGDLIGIHLIKSTSMSNPVIPIPYAIKGEDGILPSEIKDFKLLINPPGMMQNGTLLNKTDISDSTHSGAFALKVELSPTRDNIETSGACGGLIMHEGVINSPRYPSYYGASKVCTWNIDARGKFIKIDFLDIDLALRETLLSVDCSMDNSFSQSPCSDSLTVRTFVDESFIPDNRTSTLRVFRGQERALVVTDTGYVQVELISCFRSSRIDAQGFKADVTFTDYYGCCVGAADCVYCECQDWSHGYLASAGHPTSYPTDLACDWRIVVQEGFYIQLSIENIDVAAIDQKCEEDYISVRDVSYTGHVTGEPQIFCNHMKPDKPIVSSWHYMMVHFRSDPMTGGTGFLASYESMVYHIDGDLQKDIKENGMTNGCKEDEVLFRGFCYMFSQSEHPLTWMQADSNCREQGGHLVSIMSEAEMKVLHFLLTTTWATKKRESYIGLFDKNPRSQFWWADGRPLIYTAWAPKLDNDNIQPDGADLESCTMIQLTNLHSIHHWHDIPCSSNTVSQYICKRESASNQRENKVWPMEVGSLGDCEDLFRCGDGVCIQPTFICDKTFDCNDDTDELNCTTTCLDTDFQCLTGECVHLSKYCNFVQDCEDNSDEESCVYPECREDEWSCDNMECIPLDKRCDITPDCVDGSDENENYCNLFCSPKWTVQCFWGKCVPRHTWCDTVVDCAGTLAEDELDCHNTKAETCGDIRVLGYPEGLYTVRPRLMDEVDVYCSFLFHKAYTTIPSSSNQIIIASQNLESGNIEESLSQNSAPYIEQLTFIKDSADDCNQVIQIVCPASLCIRHLALMSSTRNTKRFGVSGFNCSCGRRRKEEATDFIRLSNEEVLQYTHITMQVEKRGSDSHDKSVMKINTTAMQCTEDTSKRPNPARFRCDSGQYVDAEYRCLLDLDQYGMPHGCRDMSHLTNCDTFHQLDRDCTIYGEERVVYRGKIARAENGYVCQRWEVQNPHQHMFFTDRQFPDASAGDAENYCRTPGILEDLPKPWCLVAVLRRSPGKDCDNTTMLCEVPMIPYEVAAVPCVTPTCDTSVINKTLPFECPDYYVKCPGHYCIPERYVCDGQWHCPDGEDEMNCNDFTCSGMYHCRGHSNCLPIFQVCDGIRQCPEGDDELYCSVKCPRGCFCQGFVYICVNSNLKSMLIGIVPKARKLDISLNSIAIKPTHLEHLQFLGELNLSSNGIKEIPAGLFQNQKNLFSLDLSHNHIQQLHIGSFWGLHNLKYLYLSGNKFLMHIQPGAFQNLTILPELDLSGLALMTVEEETFTGLDSLKVLSLGFNQINRMHDKAFSGVGHLLNLDLRGNSLDNVKVSVFQYLHQLTYLKSDSFKFCCFAPQVPQSNCEPPRDEISSCADLMRNNILRAFLWLLGTIAFLGNLFVIVWRGRSTINSVHELTIFHLGVADFLMGFYMICLGSVDAYYRGVYIQYAESWKNGWGCQVLGFMATLSCEGSVLFLCVITIDRFLNVVLPFSQIKLTPSSARKTILVIWITGIILSGIPLLPIPYFEGRFYSRSGVCIALPITAENPPGWEYSTALFIGFNLVGFLVIAVSYTVMYIVIGQAGRKARRGKVKGQIALARKMMLIVMSDLVCWLPIILMGCLALQGMKLPGEVYSWTIVFILPANSAINPILYTISSFNLRQKLMGKKQTKNRNQSKRSNSSVASVKKYYTEGTTEQYAFGCPPHDQTTLNFTTFLKEKYPSIRDLHQVVWRIAHALHIMHSIGMVHGNLIAENVLVNKANQLIQVYLTGFVADETSDEYDTGEDIEALGLIVKTMLQKMSSNKIVKPSYQTSSNT